MILFDNVTKKYAGTSRPALDAIDLNIERGEFVFLVGASGSGKSSCLRMMIKEDKPTSGQIHVLGQNLSSVSSRKVPYFRRRLGVVFQDFRLLPNKTVFDNVAFTLQVIGKSRGFIQEAVPDVLKMVGLAGKASRYPHELSGGEQQRVAIARAIVNKPALLLADEPTGNLDPATSAGIMSLLEAINASGTTVVVATHAADFVDQMKKRVVELSAGVIVRDERESGYGKTAAMPVAAAARSTSSDATKPAEKSAPSSARRAPSSTASPTTKIVTISETPQVESQTDAFKRLRTFATDLPETTLDAVPPMPDPFSPDVDANINDTQDMSTLVYDMLDSGVVARLPRDDEAAPITERLRAQ
ncbi:MAG: cell division ATP-binding protein FtsE [Microbacteriaceae bacterium]